jgi:hypothetical protein
MRNSVGSGLGLAAILVGFVGVAGLASQGCTFSPGTALGGVAAHSGSGGSSGAGTAGSSGITTPCENLACQQSTCKMGNCTQTACPGGAFTTLKGKVYDPAGKVPLYNVDVFIPNKPLADYTDGPACDVCSNALSGEPLARTKTDASGSFTLGDQFGDVPAGTSVPVVMQIGKWRRQVMIDTVAACSENALTDANVTRLPKSQAEGHLPKIALTTGGADALECLLGKIGIDRSEFTTEAGAGRVNLFAGEGGTSSYVSGEAFTAAQTWWSSYDHLSHYDMILHSCEGSEKSKDKSQAARMALQKYADLGGRVFASHWHNYWFEFGPAPWPGIATFNHQADLPNPFTATIDTSFDKGLALSQWLVNVQGSTTPGQLVIRGAQHTIDAVGTGQRWIYSANPMSVQYLDATTPMGAPAACGRVVLSDIHVSSGGSSDSDDTSKPSKPYPTGCVTTELSPQEKTLEFMIFDLSSCVKRIE